MAGWREEDPSERSHEQRFTRFPTDASKDAIGASVYLRLIDHKGEISTTLLFGQSRVAPAQSTSIPRLELCAATLVVQAGTRILKEIDMKIDEVTYYTDSRVVQVQKGTEH